METKPTVKIAVAYHKEAPLLQGDIYLPIQVGKVENPELDLGITTDADGDNISRDHFYMSELSATYWIWKNVTSDYKGLFHYRRIFSPKRYLRRMGDLLKSIILRRPLFCHEKVVDQTNFFSQALELESNITKIISDYDIIAPRKVYSISSTSLWFQLVDKYIGIMVEIINEKYPAYSELTKKCLDEGNFHFANMSIMKSEIFDEYCNFLFTIIFNIRDKIIERGYLIDPYKERIIERQLGYIGEILTNIFIKDKIQKGFKVKQLSVIRYV